MTVLIAIWTAYIFTIGSWLKDRRLEFFLGAWYRKFKAKCPAIRECHSGHWAVCRRLISEPPGEEVGPIDNSQSRLNHDFDSHSPISHPAALRRLPAAGHYLAPNGWCGRTRTSPSSRFTSKLQARPDTKSSTIVRVRRRIDRRFARLHDRFSRPRIAHQKPSRPDLFHDETGKPYVEQVVSGQGSSRRLMADPLNLKRDDVLAANSGNARRTRIKKPRGPHHHADTREFPGRDRVVAS